MPEPRRPLNEDLDDDDDDGSKGEDEEVVAFDEQRDLPPQTNATEKKPPSPARPVPQVVSTRTVERRKLTTGAGGIDDDSLDNPEMMTHIESVTAIAWPPAAGKRPPRDMKRLIQGEWYIVCKVMKWGDTPALFVRANKDYNSDFGFYKPPAQYYSYFFQVGDRLQLTQVGYSSSRNKVATEIRIKPTHMFPVPASKLNWVPPPITDTIPTSDSKVGKKKAGNVHSDDDDRQDPSMHQKKKKKHHRDELPSAPSARLNHEFTHHHSMPFPTLGLQAAMHQQPHHPYQHHYHQQSQQQAHHAHQQQQQQQHKKDKMMYHSQMFQHQPSFGPTSGSLSQAQLMSSGTLLAFPSASDLGLGRGQSFYIPELIATNSSGNLMAPQSPVLGSGSPLMGGPQATMHRIPSIGGSITGPLGSFSINSPNAHTIALSYGFPSQHNFGASADLGNGGMI